MNNNGDVVYLDYASTAAIRPPSVTRAIIDYLEKNGATPGRGGHRRAVDADRIAFQCRRALAQLLDIPGDAGRIAFFPNATYALNTALRGTLRKGDRVLVTTFDHNAVLRPVHAIAQERDIDVVMVPVDATGAFDGRAFENGVDGASLVVLNAVSNVLGTALDVVAMTAIAHAAGALVLVDAAQAAGEIPFSVRDIDADMVAFTGHKGLLGPPGTGGLWLRDGIEIEPVISGGTGGDSLDRAMPVAYPDHLEAGSQNGLGMAGLGASVTWLMEQPESMVYETLRARGQQLRGGLAQLKSVHVHSPRTIAAPIVTFTSDAIDPATLAGRLDREHNVLVRAGLHCAPEVHRMMGTDRTGAVRMSCGWATTEEDIDRAVRAVDALVSARIHATGVEA